MIVKFDHTKFLKFSANEHKSNTISQVKGQAKDWEKEICQD